MPQILIIEDDADIRRLVSSGLASFGHDVESAATAMSGLQSVVDLSPDLVVLDLGLPDLDGLELLRMIRAVSGVAVVVATARDNDADIIELLDAGADDYVVKPYSVEQLEARIRAVLRRTDSTGLDGPIVVGTLSIDRERRTVLLGDAPVELTPKEFELLAYLASRPDRVVSKRELLAEVWRQPYGGSDRTVDVHVSWVRKKLGESADQPTFIHTIRGVGIKLVTPEP